MANEFHLTGGAWKWTADSADVGISPDRSPLEGCTVTFQCNIKANQALPTEGGVIFVMPRTATVASDGDLLDEQGNTGIDLIANNPDFDLEVPVQWKITVSPFVHNGKTIRPKSYWVNAPEVGASVTIDELTPVPGADMSSVSRGPRGLRSQLIKVADGPPPLYQWRDEFGTFWGAQQAYADVFADSASIAVGEAVPDAVAADIAAREFDHIDNGDGSYTVTLGGIPFVGPLSAAGGVWSGIAGRGAGVRNLTGGIVPLDDYNPTADPAQALIDAITEASNNGGRVRAYTARDYVLEEPVTLTDMHVRLEANGARFLRAASALTDDFTALNIIHTNSTPQAVLSIDNAALFTPDWPNTLRILSRVAKIQVASTAGWAVNDYAVIVSDDPITAANPDRAVQYKGDRARIAKVEAGFLYTTMPLRETFTTNIRIARMTKKDVYLTDPWGEDEPGSPTGRISPFINIRGAVAPVVNNWRPRNLMSMGMKFEGCVNGRVNGVDAYNLRTQPPNAYGYGIVTVSCNDFTIRNADGEQLRHIITTGQGSNMSADSPDLHRYGRCINVNQTDGRAGQTGHAAFDLHEEAMDCVIEGNSVDFNHREPDGTAAAIQIRGVRNIARGNRTRGPGGIKLYAYDGGGDFLVEGNAFELVPGVYGTSAFGTQFDNSATASATRPKATYRNNTHTARGAEVSVYQLNKAAVRFSNERLTSYNAAALGAYRPFSLTDSEISGDVEFDLAGISGTVRLFYLADSTSSVRMDTIKVTTDGASWGIGHFNSLNGTITIGRIECDTIPSSTLVSNMGTTATLSIGDVIVNGQSRKDGLASYTNSGATVTLNALAFGRQQLAVPITATRTVTESTLVLHIGRTIKFTRTAAATGAFSWVIGSDALATPGTWLERTWDGTAWFTSAKGTL